MNSELFPESAKVRITPRLKASILSFETKSNISGVVEKLAEETINFKDDITIKALIALGWTPPNSQKTVEKTKPIMYGASIVIPIAYIAECECKERLTENDTFCPECGSEIDWPEGVN